MTENDSMLERFGEFYNRLDRDDAFIHVRTAQPLNHDLLTVAALLTIAASIDDAVDKLNAVDWNLKRVCKDLETLRLRR